MTLLKLILLGVPVLAIAFVAAWQLSKGEEAPPAISMVVTVIETATPTVEAPLPTVPPTPAEELSPTPEPSPEARPYTVQAGEGLAAICQRELPTMVPSECVAQIVELSSLPSADQLAVGQVILLPPAP